MKKVFKLLVLAFFTAFMSTFTGCKKDAEIREPEIPTVTTLDVSMITPTSAVGGGVLSSSGGSKVISLGVCWSTTPNPTVADNVDSVGVGSNPTFSSTMNGLEPNTTYYVRAFATNNVGIAYGNEISFKMAKTIATITTTAVTEIAESKCCFKC